MNGRVLASVVTCFVIGSVGSLLAQSFPRRRLRLPDRAVEGVAVVRASVATPEDLRQGYR